ncbi:zinc finger protein 862-like [Saccoglossus kowalevskii]
MKCRICLKSGKRNPFTDADGCKNYRTSTVARHASSALHLEAVKATIMRADTEAAVSTVFTKKQAMKTVYWLAKEAISTDKYSSLLELLHESVQQRELDARKMMGLGSDGASVMELVSAKLKGTNPFLINIHCVTHRLALCTSQAAGGVEYLKQYRGILTSLFYYFKQSSLRSSRFKGMEKILDSPELKIKEIHAVHWFAFYDSLQTVYRSWNALVTYFDQSTAVLTLKLPGKNTDIAA